MTGSSARQAAGLAVLMVFSGLACSDPTDVDPCSGSVELTVIERPIPEFRWGPCAVNSLVVFDGAAQPIWNVHAPSTANTMGPPIHYAQVPEGAVEDDPAQPLLSGYGYVVRVFRTERDGERVLFLESGEANFRW